MDYRDKLTNSYYKRRYMPWYKKVFTLFGFAVIIFLIGYFIAWGLEKRLELTSREEILSKTESYNQIALDNWSNELKNKANDAETFIVLGIILVILFIPNIKKNKLKKIFREKTLNIKKIIKHIFSWQGLLILIFVALGYILQKYIERHALANPESAIVDLNISKWFIYLYLIVIIGLKMFISYLSTLREGNDYEKSGRGKKLFIISFLVIIVIFMVAFRNEITGTITPLGIDFSYWLIDVYKNIGLL